VNLGPRLDEPALPPRKLTTDELDRVDRNDADVILVVRMEVWSVVRSRRLGKYSNDDSEEPRDLGHRWSAAAGLYAADFRRVNVRRWIRRTHEASLAPALVSTIRRIDARTPDA